MANAAFVVMISVKKNQEITSQMEFLEMESLEGDMPWDRLVIKKIIM